MPLGMHSNDLQQSILSIPCADGTGQRQVQGHCRAGPHRDGSSAEQSRAASPPRLDAPLSGEYGVEIRGIANATGLVRQRKSIVSLDPEASNGFVKICCVLVWNASQQWQGKTRRLSCFLLLNGLHKSLVILYSLCLCFR